MTLAPVQLPQQPKSSPYDWLNTLNLDTLGRHITGKTIDKVVDERVPGSSGFSRDLSALTTDSHPFSYEILKSDLVARLVGFSSGQAYGSVALNEVGDVFTALIGYMGLLEANVKEIYGKRADPEKIRELRFAVVEAFARKTPSAKLFIPQNTEIWEMYEVAERERMKQLYTQLH